MQTFLPLTATIEDATTMDLCVMADRSRPALAALALYGQPFGFTRTMVKALRSATGYMAHYAVNAGEEFDLAEAAIDRIEALLPPE